MNTQSKQLQTLSIIPKVIFFDFDGVFTDNKVYVNQHGDEMVCCSRADSLGLSLIRKRITLVVVSTETNGVVASRCEKLGIPSFQGYMNKKEIVQKWLIRNGIESNDAMFVGNDVNDLDAMACCGVSACPNDANAIVKNAASIVLSHLGGNGAIRELCDYLIKMFDEA